MPPRPLPDTEVGSLTLDDLEFHILDALEFRILHALRIKGLASSGAVADIAGLQTDGVTDRLLVMQAEGLVTFREARALWQLTTTGRATHAAALLDGDEGDSSEPAAVSSQLEQAYSDFLALNARFKQLCCDWQLRDGVRNDHSDRDYDASVVERLLPLHTAASHLVDRMAEVVPRLARYAERLERACRALVEGDTPMLTGVMCASYHDVWMELHEDVILTRGLDRAQEGSF